MARLSRRAEKDLEQLPAHLRRKAAALVARLDADPALGKKLLGALEGKRSARLGRSHRIVYTVGAAGVVVLTVAPRRDAYR